MRAAVHAHGACRVNVGVREVNWPWGNQEAWVRFARADGAGCVRGGAGCVWDRVRNVRGCARCVVDRASEIVCLHAVLSSVHWFGSRLDHEVRAEDELKVTADEGSAVRLEQGGAYSVCGVPEMQSIPVYGLGGVWVGWCVVGWCGVGRSGTGGSGTGRSGAGVVWVGVE